MNEIPSLSPRHLPPPLPANLFGGNRREVYRILQEEGIDLPRYAVLNRDPARPEGEYLALSSPTLPRFLWLSPVLHSLDSYVPPVSVRLCLLDYG